MFRRDMRILLLTIVVTATGIVWIRSTAIGGGQHDNGSIDADHPSEEPDPLSSTVVSGKLLAFVEYPRPVVGGPTRVHAHFSELATGMPVARGRLTLVVRGPNGTQQEVVADSPSRPGVFLPVATFGEAGPHQIEVRLDSPDINDEFTLCTLEVYPDAGAALAAANAEHDHPPDNAVPFLLEQQWMIGLRVARAKFGDLVERLELPGEVILPSGAYCVVNAPSEGLFQPPSGRRMPQLGDKVEAGAPLATVVPAAQPMSETVVDILDFELQGVTIAEELQQALANHRFAQSEWKRVSGLYDRNTASSREFEEIKRNLDVAEADLAAARDMLARHRRISDRLDPIRALISIPDRSEEIATAFSIPIMAPISGTIVDVSQVSGAHVDAGERLYRIVDSRRVWVRADVSEFDLEKLPRNLNAVVLPDALPLLRIDVKSAGGRFVHQSPEVNPVKRTVAIFFELPNDDQTLKAGMIVTIFLETNSSVDAIIVPNSAVVREGGMTTVFVLIDGETFQKRPVELGISDGRRVEVTRGLQAGEYVVIDGASVLRLAGSQEDSIGHGHVH